MSKKNKFIQVKVIVNPDAGKVADTKKNLKFVTDYLEKHGLKVNVAFAKPKEKATPIVKRAIKNGYKIVIAMGGDGTVEAVMHGMVGTKAHMGIIPTGIENNIAKSLGIPLELEEACSLIISGNIFKLDMGHVKTSKGKKFNFFEMATIGFSTAIYPSGDKLISNQSVDSKDDAKTLDNQENKPKIFLTMDDESKIKVETMLVMVSNIPILGKNFRVAPEASLQDGLLDISVYPDFSKDELSNYYAAMQDGGYSGEGNIQHYQARKLKVKSSPKLKVIADGVALGSGTVTIKVRPGALRVITPKKNPDLESSKEDVVEILPQPASPSEEKDI
jgi:diacylglycerol kinase (ATP)